MVYAFLVLFVAYSLIVLAFIGAWRTASKERESTLSVKPSITVLVPMRNESVNVGVLIEDLKSQTYSNFQVVLIDDHSDDNTIDVAKKHIGSDTRFIILWSPEIGKKRALRTGVENSTAEIIVTTDADTRREREWLSIISQSFQDASLEMLVGPVKVQSRNFFGDLQAIEFAALIGTTAATIRLGYPTMCNGANLAFRRNTFQAVGGYDDNFNIASGDDEFLMRKVIQHGGQVRFLMNPLGVVSTSAMSSVGDFVSQRLRWAGKWRYNNSGHTVLLALTIFLFQLSTIGWMILLVARHQPWLAASVLLTKAAIEAFFLIPVCRFLKVRWNWLAFTALQLLHPFYVVGIGLFSNFLSSSWKGRKI